jgi:trans-2-enoyl-CoA reductase
VLDCGEGIIEAVQERLPLLIFGRGAEANGVVFERLPMDEQYVTAGVLNATAELV